MLKRIRLKDFKSFVDESVELAPLTILVGPNASGKSNFVDALRFLHGTTLGLSVQEVRTRSQRPTVWTARHASEDGQGFAARPTKLHDTEQPDSRSRSSTKGADIR